MGMGSTPITLSSAFDWGPLAPDGSSYGQRDKCRDCSELLALGTERGTGWELNSKVTLAHAALQRLLLLRTLARMRAGFLRGCLVVALLVPSAPWAKPAWSLSDSPSASGDRGLALSSSLSFLVSPQMAA